jgi:hypothetical protein
MALLRDSLLAHDALDEGRGMKSLEAVECKCGKMVQVSLDVGEEKRVVCDRCGHAMVVRIEESKAA